MVGHTGSLKYPSSCLFSANTVLVGNQVTVASVGRLVVNDIRLPM